MRLTLFSFLVVSSLILGPSAANAGADQDQMKTTAAHQDAKMTPELKKDMADMYQKMADCVRSDKSVEACSHEAMKDCPVVAKTGHCPINEGMGLAMGKRMKHSAKAMENMKNMTDGHPMDSGG